MKNVSNAIGFFASIRQHAPIQDIHDAVDELKKTESDGIIAVGGGSPIDAAKVVVGLYKEVTGTVLKLISIPTTLSAAESTIGAGFTGKFIGSEVSEPDRTVIKL